MRARTLLGLMRAFPAYTLAQVKAESVELIRLVNIETAGKPTSGSIEGEESWGDG